jgi:hypothetical protein
MVRGGNIAAAALLAACASLYAQQPQLVWEGVVDGTSILSIRGNRIQIEDREGMPVQRQRYRFYDRLPDSRQDVRLEVREGRGRVRVVQQPRLENNYVLQVSVEDRQGGASPYLLEFYWETARGGFFGAPPVVRSSEKGDRLSWSGRVDDEAIISCRGNECRAESTRGGPVTRERARISRPLPRRDTTVSLEDTQGRGEIRLVEQPREENGYTARVRIRDPQGGAGDYSFTLAWAPPPRFSGDGIARRGMVWSGRVDGRVRVFIEGRRAWAETVSGAPVSGERADFYRDLPRRENSDATVRRLRGRGRLELIESPSRRNGYRLVFEIDDHQGGAENYEVEAGW